MARSGENGKWVPFDGINASEYRRSPDLIAVPDIAPLKFGKSHVAAVDMIEDR
ncbi:MAG: hypothetical protein OXI81_03105 [Paracoccaceae bacterium]|nr:hypothetical protein [Paracoccaceae bacterium]